MIGCHRGCGGTGLVRPDTGLKPGVPLGHLASGGAGGHPTRSWGHSRSTCAPHPARVRPAVCVAGAQGREASGHAAVGHRGPASDRGWGSQPWPWRRDLETQRRQSEGPRAPGGGNGKGPSDGPGNGAGGCRTEPPTPPMKKDGSDSPGGARHRGAPLYGYPNPILQVRTRLRKVAWADNSHRVATPSPPRCATLKGRSLRWATSGRPGPRTPAGVSVRPAGAGPPSDGLRLGSPGPLGTAHPQRGVTHPPGPPAGGASAGVTN